MLVIPSQFLQCCWRWCGRRKEKMMKIFHAIQNIFTTCCVFLSGARSGCSAWMKLKNSWGLCRLTSVCFQANKNNFHETLSNFNEIFPFKMNSIHFFLSSSTFCSFHFICQLNNNGQRWAQSTDGVDGCGWMDREWKWNQIDSHFVPFTLFISLQSSFSLFIQFSMMELKCKKYTYLFFKLRKKYAICNCIIIYILSSGIVVVVNW